MDLSSYADEEFALRNQEAFDAYIDYRVEGTHAHVAFTVLFGEDPNNHLKTIYMEHNPYFRREFVRKLNAKKVEELWDSKKAVNAYMNMYKNPYFKDTTRLQALKELCVLCGITEVDDAGRTRRMPTLNDLYPSDPVKG